jgi:ATP-dependent helicase HrpA
MADPRHARDDLPDELLLRDRHALRAERRRIESRRRRGQPVDRSEARLARHLDAALQRYRARRDARPPRLDYPTELPIVAHREELLGAIRERQVVILAGETGSGKTTQLPKLCLEAGRGLGGLIGHTQPRRLAAQAVAARVAEELGSPLGDLVGYQVRFDEQVSERSLVKMMTDGILLAEVPHDRLLRRYDTLIIDEAHERSLNIDFLLGYLKTILPQRPDLRLIVTSATIDVERFAQYFDGAPVYEVSGRSYPVEVRYRPREDSELDQPAAVLAALEEIRAESRHADGRPRDVLVFHSGEQEIRETAHALRRAQLRDLEVLPLYSRLSQAEQARVLKPRQGGPQRVVLCTNVAETSLTVPGIGYVIDPGFARISRYSLRAKVQTLPIEPVSQASAEQRKGRCGRLAPGVCIRLYSEESFAARPAFTEPEIRRTNLAAVILQMHQLGLGEVAAFPFLEAPDPRQINDGIGLLAELGALHRNRLTDTGHKLARLPVDPRLGRMLLAAADAGALREMLVLTSFLSIQDPRERPADRQQAADQAHARFRDPDSDFAAVLALWDYVENQRQELSAGAFRRLCQKEFLSWLRLREWRDVHRQLRLLCRELGLAENREAPGYAALHQSLLAGMLSQVGSREEGREFAGVRNRRFVLHPASALARKPPKWVVCAELVETTRLFGRTAARIEPEWLLPWAAEVIKREYYEPTWRQRSGRVMARERLRLYGLVIADGKWVNYAPIVPAEARQLFIQGALVEARFESRHRFWQHNQALRAELAELEARGRRRDLVVEDRAIFEFYDERLPADVCDRPSLDRWLRRQGEAAQQALCMAREYLVRLFDHGVTTAQFPDELVVGDLRLPLAYRFEPGHESDGVTVTVPLLALGRLPAWTGDWLVPGLLRDKCIALLKLLPKAQRRQLVPIPDTVDELLAAVEPGQGPLLAALGDWLARRRRVTVVPSDWPVGELEPFYRMRFVVVDEQGEVVDTGRDLEALQSSHREAGHREVQAAAAPGWRVDGMRRWDCGALPEEVAVDGGSGFPALIDQGNAVGLRVFASRPEAVQAHRRAVIRLLRLAERGSEKYLRKQLLRDSTVLLAFGARASRDALLDDLLEAATDEAWLRDAPLPRDGDAFARLHEAGRAALVPRAQELEALLGRVAQALRELTLRRSGLKDPVYAESLADLDRQLDALLQEHFLSRTPAQWRPRLPAYLQAAALRLEKLPDRLPRDLEACWELQELQERLEAAQADGRLDGGRAQALRWLLEEYRISLFAQQLGTAQPVSRKRLERLLEQA